MGRHGLLVGRWPVENDPGLVEDPRGHLPIAPIAGRPLRELVEEATRAVERAAILDALEKSGGSPTRAARLLGISRASIYNKLKEYEIPT